MKEPAFLHRQAAELRGLLEEVDDDEVLGPQFRERLAEIEGELKKAPAQPSAPQTLLPRTAMFLRGGGVHGSVGIRPALAADVLTQYEKMFTEQALHEEREIARGAGRARRPKGSAKPGLLFTGTPRGSFGLEFVPQSPDDPSLRAAYQNAIASVTDAIVKVASGDVASADSVLAQVPGPVLKPMRLFMKSLASHGAELRVAFQGRPSYSLSAAQIARAAEQLDREVTQEEVVFNGRFRGVTLQSGYFDFLTDDEQSITGTVGEDLPAEYLEDILDRTNKPAQAVIQVTTIRPVTGEPKITYVLLKANDHPG